MKFCHVTIYVKNLEESLHCYRDILDLPIQRQFSPGPNVNIAFLGDGETEIELIDDPRKNDVSIGADISLGFEVNSVQEAQEFLRKNNITPGEIQQPSPQVKFFFVSDPNGVTIQFSENEK
ncbi:MAG: VOC family protein [Muricomes sp.]